MFDGYKNIFIILIFFYVSGPIHGSSDNQFTHSTLVVAHHEAGHAMMLILLNPKHVLDKVSILAQNNHLGLTQRIILENVELSIEEYLDEICICMAGFAGEELFLSKKTVWKESTDYQHAYKMAKFVAQGLKINDVHKIIDQEYLRAINFLKKDQKKLIMLVQVLLERKVLIASEIYELFKTIC